MLLFSKIVDMYLLYKHAGIYKSMDIHSISTHTVSEMSEWGFGGEPEPAVELKLRFCMQVG